MKSRPRCFGLALRRFRLGATATIASPTFISRSLACGLSMIFRQGLIACSWPIARCRMGRRRAMCSRPCVSTSVTSMRSRKITIRRSRVADGTIFLDGAHRAVEPGLRVHVGDLFQGKGVLVIGRTFAAGRVRSRLFGAHSSMITRRASTSRRDAWTGCLSADLSGTAESVNPAAKDAQRSSPGERYV